MIAILERLVHGPLTALMLLEVAGLSNGKRALKSFEYRAVNPIVVNRPVCIGVGPEEEGRKVRMWAKDRVSGMIGMIGTITLVN